MAGYLKVTAVGNVGADAELAYSNDGVARTTFNIAVNKKRKGEDVTTWIRVTVFRQLAETCATYVKRGMQVLVEGDLDVSAYAAKDSGEPRASVDVIARDVLFLRSKANGNEQSDTPF